MPSCSHRFTIFESIGGRNASRHHKRHELQATGLELESCRRHDGLATHLKAMSRSLPQSFERRHQERFVDGRGREALERPARCVWPTVRPCRESRDSGILRCAVCQFSPLSLVANSWSSMAKILKGRTDNDIKNKWNSMLRKHNRMNQKIANELGMHDIQQSDTAASHDQTAATANSRSSSETQECGSAKSIGV
jgi:hypothetical protein